MNLSDEAKSALINAGSSREGTRIQAGDAQGDLFGAGLTGHFGGLTRKGSIERERLLAEAEDKAFGA